MRFPRDEDCREDVVSTETWNGGSGTITFNHLQQREPDTTVDVETPLEAAGTTDVWDIVDD